MGQVGLKELTDRFEYVENERGLSATRVFSYDSDSVVVGPDLPNPGSLFMNPLSGSIPGSNHAFVKLFCRTRSMSPLAGHPMKAIYTCTYTNEPVDTNCFYDATGTITPTPIADLPATMEHSGEFSNLNVNKINGWTWESDGTAVVQPVPFRVVTSTIRFTKFVTEDQWLSFYNAARDKSQKINQTADPFGASYPGGVGCYLFNNAQTEMFRNYLDNGKMWRAELEFIYRNPDSSASEGWNKILNLNGKWDKPVNPNPISPSDKYLYTHTDFAALFT